MVMKDDPKKPLSGRMKSYSRVIKRDASGKLDESESEVKSTEIYENDNARKAAAKPGSGSYDGTAAPRVGGGPIMKQGLPSGGSKKQIKAAKFRVNKSSASPAAKASARRLYR